MRRLILHAGMHKTGTTAIQSVASKNRDDLYAKGVYYPKSWDFFGNDPNLPSANAHFSLFDALVDGKPRDLDRLDRFRNHLSHDIPKDMTVLISAESMNRHVVGQDGSFWDKRARFLAKMAEYFSVFQTEVVMYFRQPDAFAESLFSESAVSSPRYADFMASQARYVARFGYKYMHDSYSKHFPISCQSFEGQKTDLPRNFFNALGLPLPADSKETTRRPSVPKLAVLWIFRAKRDNGGDMDRPQRVRRWLFGLQRENADIFRVSESVGFWPDTASRDAFCSAMLEGFDKIRLPEPKPLLPQCSWSDTDHAAAERRFRDWVEEHSDWLQYRAERRIAPFVDSQAPA